MGRELIENPYCRVFWISLINVWLMCWSFLAAASCLLSRCSCHLFGTEIATITDKALWGRFFFCTSVKIMPASSKWICWVSSFALLLYNYHGNPSGMENGSNPRQECHGFPQFLPVVLWFFMSNHFFICFMFLVNFQSSQMVVLTVFSSYIYYCL